MSADCPRLTAEDLQLLGGLPRLEVLRLRSLAADSVGDAVLASLEGCTRLRELSLGFWSRPVQMEITAAAVTRSVSQHTPTQAAVHLHPEVGILTHSCMPNPEVGMLHIPTQAAVYLHPEVDLLT